MWDNMLRVYVFSRWNLLMQLIVNSIPYPGVKEEWEAKIKTSILHDCRKISLPRSSIFKRVPTRRLVQSFRSARKTEDVQDCTRRTPGLFRFFVNAQLWIFNALCLRYPLLLRDTCCSRFQKFPIERMRLDSLYSTTFYTATKKNCQLTRKYCLRLIKIIQRHEMLSFSLKTSFYFEKQILFEKFVFIAQHISRRLNMKELDYVSNIASCFFSNLLYGLEI